MVEEFVMASVSKFKPDFSYFAKPDASSMKSSSQIKSSVRQSCHEQKTGTETKNSTFAWLLYIILSTNA